MSTTITETCGCGANITITTADASQARMSVTDWRKGHRHAESVGICGDKAPLVIPEGSEMAPMFCDLKAGHAGAHSNGDGHWTRTTEETP